MTAYFEVNQQRDPVLDLTTPQLSSELTAVEGRLQVLRGVLDAMSRLDEINEVVRLCTSHEGALEALQQEPFCYGPAQAAAVLDIPVSAQTVDETQRLRNELEHLNGRRVAMRERLTEVLSLHWFG